MSPGGTSLASDADFIPAETASMVIAQGGLGGLSRIDLEKVLAGTTAFVRADIGETEEGLGGGASSKDLEAMFQLVYLTFTAPRADPVAFGVLTDQLKVTLANQSAMPDTVFDEALDAALSQNHLRAQPLTPARLDADEPRQVARLLQGPLRRCERLHLRLRGELRSRHHEAARGALPGRAFRPSTGTRPRRTSACVLQRASSRSR